MMLTGEGHIPAEAGQRLRTVLALNAAFSATTGAAALALGPTVADDLGIEPVWLVRLVGAGLVGFAAVVAFVARSGRPILRRGSGTISAADLAWVAATVVVIAVGWPSARGAVILALLGFVVFGFGAGQLLARRRLGGGGPAGHAEPAGTWAPKNPAR